MSAVKPEGFQAITPYLNVTDMKAFMEFAEKGLGATTVSKMETDDGMIMHAELKFDDSMIMAGQTEDPSKMTPAQLYYYVENCDQAYEAAMKAGAESIIEPKDQFYGDRNAAVRDQWGNQWWFATHQRKVSNEEINEKMKEMN